MEKNEKDERAAAEMSDLHLLKTPLHEPEQERGMIKSRLEL